MPAISKSPTSKAPRKPATKQRDLGAVIDRFANEFMLKPGARRFDSVGEFIKARRGA